MKPQFRRERVSLDAIVFDAGTQIRVAINEHTVADYAERMTDGVEFPPVVLFHDGVRYYLADGFHRTLAAKRNEFRDIEADVEVGTRADALWFALGANKANGQRLTEADKKQAVTMALSAFPEKSAGAIAEQVGCAQTFVSRVRQQVSTSVDLPSRVTGKDGKSYPASRQAVDPRRQQVTEMLLADKSNTEIIAVIGAQRNDLIADVRRELGIDGPSRAKSAVHDRRERLRDLAAEGYSTRQIATEIGVLESTVKVIAKQEAIDIPADRIIGKTKRHDANRIIGQMVSDAENLCADVDLIDFEQIDGAQLSAWIESFQVSRRALSAFIRRLEQEQKKHGEAA